MTTHLLRTVAVSVVHPLLQLSRCTLKSRGLATCLHGPLQRAALLLRSSPVVQCLLPNPLTPCLLQPALGFKTKGVIRKRCKDCYRVKRRGRWYIYCKTNPKHKQRQM